MDPPSTLIYFTFLPDYIINKFNLSQQLKKEGVRLGLFWLGLVWCGLVMVWLWFGHGLVMVWLWFGYGLVMVWL